VLVAQHRAGLLAVLLVQHRAVLLVGLQVQHRAEHRVEVVHKEVPRAGKAVLQVEPRVALLAVELQVV